MATAGLTCHIFFNLGYSDLRGNYSTQVTKIVFSSFSVVEIIHQSSIIYKFDVYNILEAIYFQITF